MNKFGLLLLMIIILNSYYGYAQDHLKNYNKWNTIVQFREDILSDLKRGDLSSCLKSIEMNKLLIKNNNLLTFNEYWTINILCKNPILTTDFYKQKALRQFYSMKYDSLAVILYSLAKDRKVEIKNTIDEIYKNKVEHSINELFLDMLLSSSNDSIQSFKEKKEKFIKEYVGNERECPDSLFDLIQYQEIRNTLKASGSIELKRYNNQTLVGYDKLVKRNYGLSFSLSGPRFLGAILMGWSFDVNLIETFDQKYFFIRDNKYYLNEYSDTSNIKIDIGLYYSLGLLLFNNQKFNASLSGFIGGYRYEKGEGFSNAGLSLVSNIYLPKYHKNANINGLFLSKKACKISINYDFINNQASIVEKTVKLTT